MGKSTPSLAAARKALENGQFAKVIEQAKAFLEAEDPASRQEAYRLIGLAYFRQDDFQRAREHFRTLVQTSEAVTDWFNFVITSALTHDLTTSKQALEKAFRLYESASDKTAMSIPWMRYYYACALRDGGHWPEALEQVEALRAVYEQLHITDDTFLAIRGIPFLKMTLELAMRVFWELGKDFDYVGWLKSFAEHLDEDGKALIAQWLNEMGPASA